MVKDGVGLHGLQTTNLKNLGLSTCRQLDIVPLNKLYCDCSQCNIGDLSVLTTLDLALFQSCKSWLDHGLCNHNPASETTIIIWLAPRAGKMNQIAHSDWLPERARWSHLARSGLHAVSRKQSFTKSHIIDPLLTKFVWSRWLDIGLVLFLRVYGPRLRLGP